MNRSVKRTFLYISLSFAKLEKKRLTAAYSRKGTGICSFRSSSLDTDKTGGYPAWNFGWVCTTQTLLEFPFSFLHITAKIFPLFSAKK